jgi:hypothetical protein
VLVVTFDSLNVCSGNSELTKAVRSATEKATAAVSSINEQYKISEGLANVASIVEKKGLFPHPFNTLRLT